VCFFEKGLLMSNRKMNVLAIGSHPDDIEFGCGGTLHKLACRGHGIYLLVLTSGNAGGNFATRKSEQLRAARALHATDVFWGNFTDTKLPFYENVIQEIEDVVKKVSPTFVFVHHGKDTHQDHRHVSECTVVATRNVPNVLFYEGPTTINFAPNVYIDIGDFVKEKIKTISCHRSQIMKTNIKHQSILEIAKATAMFRGTQCRIQYAEGFVSLRMFIMQ
jgi:LmbE family N-acetylglucosaminyl deacetylase